MNRKLVILTDLRDQIRDGDAVLRLHNVIETRIIHDRRRVTVLAQEVLVADLLEGVDRARLHVVLEPESVTNLVRDDKSKQFTHEIVGKRELLRAWIERAYLNEVPVLLEVLNVVVELN